VQPGRVIGAAPGSQFKTHAGVWGDRAVPGGNEFGGWKIELNFGGGPDALAGIIFFAAIAEEDLIAGELHGIFLAALPVILFLQHDESIGHAGTIAEAIG